MDIPALAIEPHPSLSPAIFVTELPQPLGQLETPGWLRDLLALEPQGEGAFRHSREEEIRKGVRDLLRHGGYRPTGRGKPASEYLVRAAGEEKLGTINLAVDACNAASLASGFPISVVDLERARAPFSIGLAEQDASYVFNASGQTIALGGLLCLFDAEGPCANAVKDCQRTKTHGETRQTLSVIWGTRSREGRVEETCAWYRELLERAGAQTEPITLAE